MKTCSFLWLLCCVMAQSKTITPDLPSRHVGPFDLKDNRPGLSPPGDDQEDGYDTKTLFQGDIKDPGRKKGGTREKRDGSRTLPWPNAVIPYVFDCSVSSKRDRKATYDAIEEWEKKTCVRFVKKQPHQKVYLEFIRESGCWANVGYRGRKTQVSIGADCGAKNVMLHELGHVMGLWHEQNRPDRDSYVRIDFDNIEKDNQDNFEIVRNQRTYGEPYDFNSIMHYGFKAFAKDETRNTIIPKDSRILKTAKPGESLSEIDVRDIRKMYQCDKMTIVRSVRKRSLADASSRIGAKCEDSEENRSDCPTWADLGDCETDEYGDFMRANCKKSCGVCISGAKCEDSEENRSDCPTWADLGYCETDEDGDFMRANCKKSCDVCNSVPKATMKPTTKPPTTVQTAVVSSTISKPRGNFTGKLCQDRNPNCKEWSKRGECENNPTYMYSNCMISCKRFKECDMKMIRPIGVCSDPLGVYSNKRIPDNRMYATTTFLLDDGWSAPAFSGRLYKEDDDSNKHAGAWCANPKSNKKKYLQIDFGEKKRITALATQGRDVYFEHVKSYSLAFSDDRRTWHEYREGTDKKVFDGNCDHVTPVLNILESAQIARYIRIYPIKYFGAACLRVEVYGCNY